MNLLERSVTKINMSMMWIAGFFIISMGLITTLNIIFRTIFSVAILWTFDATCYASAAAAFLAGGYGLLMNRHVKVDIIYDMFSPRNKAIIDVCTSIFFFILCGALIWFGSLAALSSFLAKSTAGNILNPPLWLPQLLVPLSGLLLGLQGIFVFIRNFKIAIGYEGTKGVND